MVFNEKLEAKMNSIFGGGLQVAPIEDAEAGLKEAGQGEAAPGPPVAADGGEAQKVAETPSGPSGDAPKLLGAPAAGHRHHGDSFIVQKAAVKTGADGHHISEHHLRRIHHKAHCAHHHVHTHENLDPEYIAHKKELKSKTIEIAEKKAQEDAAAQAEEAKKAEEAKQAEEEANESEETDDIEALMKAPEDMKEKISWALCLPIYAGLYYTIPRPGPKWFMATFACSLVWIATYSYFLVYCVQMFANTVLDGECNEGMITVLGFTILAAGTSIPDLVSSMAVARA